jgi:hypothetical protein
MKCGSGYTDLANVGHVMGSCFHLPVLFASCKLIRGFERCGTFGKFAHVL